MNTPTLENQIRRLLAARGNWGNANANRAQALFVQVRNRPNRSRALTRNVANAINAYNVGNVGNSNSNNNVARRLNFNNANNMNVNNNFNWNSNGNLVNFPARLRNNRESLTLNNFKPGQRYVQVIHGNTRAYFNLNAFKTMWQRGRRKHPLLSNVKLTSNNLSIVKFKNKNL